MLGNVSGTHDKRMTSPSMQPGPKEVATDHGTAPNRRKALGTTALIGIGAGIAAGVAALVIGAGSGPIANFGQYVQDFVKSPGLGGLAALTAAIIAYQGIKGQIRTSRDALTSQQIADQANRWWATFQWTADRALPLGADDVPIPKPVAIATLTELATTARDHAQSIACSGLVDVLGDEREDSLSSANLASDAHTGADASAARRVFLSTASQLKADSLDAALSTYAKATQGGPAESSVARRSAYESQVRESIAEVARRAGLDYESAAIASPLGDLGLDERYWADGVIQTPGGNPALVEVIAYERAGARIAERLRTIASNATYPVIIVAPLPLPDFMRDCLRSPEHWIQWTPGDDIGALEEAILQIVT